MMPKPIMLSEWPLDSSTPAANHQVRGVKLLYPGPIDFFVLFSRPRRLAHVVLTALLLALHG
jgi:hypothetical protein